MLALAGFPTTGRKALALGAFVLIAAFEALGALATHLSQENTLSAAVAAWLPNVVLILTAGAIAVLGRRSKSA